MNNGQEVILSPRVENLTDTPQKIKEAVVLIPKSEAVTYLEGPVVDNSDEYDVVYTTSYSSESSTIGPSKYVRASVLGISTTASFTF